MNKYTSVIRCQAALIDTLAQVLHEQADHLSWIDREIRDMEGDLEGLAGVLDGLEVDFDRLEPIS